MDAYVRIRKIGEGSFGKALLVKRKDDGKHCVIKEINISKMGRKERDDSRKEVKVLSQMKHPNIVAYQESFEDSGSLYIVMDYCDAGDLYKRINEQRGKLFTEDQVLNWFVQLCLGLKHVHDRKILHRDIKSQNIFLTKSGVVKLGDFGIAKVLNSTVELARTCIGTPYYLSPEICENRPYNNKSDVWALGCVLYELVTLKHAFEAGNMKNLVLKIVRGSYPSVSTRYSRDLRSLIDSCLKNQPRQRPSVNGILRLPFIQKRIEGFLSETIRAEEFSHTVLHRHRLPRHTPGLGVKPLPLGVAGKAIPPKLDPPPPAPVKRYQPASVYGGGARKASDDKKKNVVVRPRPRPSRPQSVARKPISSALAARKREADERVRLQQEQIRKQHEIEAKLQHQNYARKQSAKRIQQAKQVAAQGWRATLSGGRDNKISNDQGPPREEEEKADNMEARENDSVNTDNHAKPDVQETAQRDRAEAVQAAERARMISEFHQRKREAAANKAKGQAQWGRPPIQLPPHGPIVNAGNREVGDVSGARGKNKAEEDYLSKLQAIRRQNYMERKRIQQRMQLYTPDPSPKTDSVATSNVRPSQINVEERRRKIAALKAQADEQAEIMRKKVEEKRRQRVVPVISNPSEPSVKGVEPQAKWAEPRKQWGEPPKAPTLAQQCDATGVITDGTSGIVFEEGSADPGRKQWGNEEGSPLIAMLQEKTLQSGTYAVRQDELGGQTRIDIVQVSDLPTPTPPPADQQPQLSGDTVTITKHKQSPVVEPEQLSVVDEDKTKDEDSPQDKKKDESSPQVSKEKAEGDSATSVVTKSESWVIVGGDKPDTKPGATHEESPPESQPSVRRVWGDSPAANKDVLSDALLGDENQPSSIQVQDIEEEGGDSESKETTKIKESTPDVVTSTPVIGKVQASSSEDVFSTPTGPSPTSIVTTTKKEEPPVISEEEIFSQPETNSVLSASLRVGLFDTNADMLHTCSLPDLRVLFDTNALPWDIVGEFPNEEEEPPADDFIESDEGDDHPNQAEEDPPIEDVNEGGIPSDQEEGAWSGSSDEDDDDLQQLVETLQSFVEEAKSPIHSVNIGVRADTPEEQQVPAFPITENWEDSDDDESPPDASDPDSSEAVSVFSRLEETRTLLEGKLGLPTLLEAYQLIQTFHEDGKEVSEASNNESIFPTDHLTAIIGEENTQYYPTLIHLVMADVAYAEENVQGLPATNHENENSTDGAELDSII